MEGATIYAERIKTTRFAPVGLDMLCYRTRKLAQKLRPATAKKATGTTTNITRVPRTGTQLWAYAKAKAALWPSFGTTELVESSIIP